MVSKHAGGESFSTPCCLVLPIIFSDIICGRMAFLKGWQISARLYEALSTHICNNGIIVIGYKIKKYENFTTLEGWAWSS